MATLRPVVSAHASASPAAAGSSSSAAASKKSVTSSGGVKRARDDSATKPIKAVKKAGASAPGGSSSGSAASSSGASSEPGASAHKNKRKRAPRTSVFAASPMHDLLNNLRQSDGCPKNYRKTSKLNQFQLEAYLNGVMAATARAKSNNHETATIKDVIQALKSRAPRDYIARLALPHVERAWRTAPKKAKQPKVSAEAKAAAAASGASAAAGVAART